MRGDNDWGTGSGVGEGSVRPEKRGTGDAEAEKSRISVVSGSSSDPIGPSGLLLNRCACVSLLLRVR